MPLGTRPINLTQLQIAQFNPIAGTYGTGVAFPDQRKLTINPVVTSTELVGGGGTAVAEVASFVSKAAWNIEGGGYVWDILEIVLNAANVESGTTPDVERDGKISVGNRLPIFGIIGVAEGLDTGDVHYGLPLCTLSEAPEWVLDADTGEFVVSNMSGTAWKDANGYLIYPLAQETASAPDFTTLFA